MLLWKYPIFQSIMFSLFEGIREMISFPTIFQDYPLLITTIQLLCLSSVLHRAFSGRSKEDLNFLGSAKATFASFLLPHFIPNSEFGFVHEFPLLCAMVVITVGFSYVLFYLYYRYCTPRTAPTTFNVAAVQLPNRIVDVSCLAYLVTSAQAYRCSFVTILAYVGVFQTLVSGCHSYFLDLFDIEANRRRQLEHRFNDLSFREPTWPEGFHLALGTLRESEGISYKIKVECAEVLPRLSKPVKFFNGEYDWSCLNAPCVFWANTEGATSWIITRDHEVDFVTAIDHISQMFLKDDGPEYFAFKMACFFQLAQIYPFPEFGTTSYNFRDPYFRFISYVKMFRHPEAREVSHALYCFHERYYPRMLSTLADPHNIPRDSDFYLRETRPGNELSEILRESSIHWAAQAKFAHYRAHSYRFSPKTMLLMVVCLATPAAASPADSTQRTFSTVLSVMAFFAAALSFIDWHRVGAVILGKNPRSKFDEALEAAKRTVRDVETGFYDARTGLKPESGVAQDFISSYLNGYAMGQCIFNVLRTICLLFIVPFNVFYCYFSSEPLSSRPHNWWNRFDPNVGVQVEATPLSILSEISPALSSLMENTGNTKSIAIGLMFWSGYPYRSSKRDKFIFVASSIYLLVENFRDSLLKDRIFEQLSNVFDLGRSFGSHREAAEFVMRRAMQPESDEDDIYSDYSTWEPPKWLLSLKTAFETGCSIDDSLVARKCRDFLSYLSAIAQLNWNKLDYCEFERVREIARDKLGRNPSLRSFIGSTVAAFELAAASKQLGFEGAYKALEYGNSKLYSEAAELNRMLVEGEIGLSSSVSKIDALRRISLAHTRAQSEVNGLRGIRKRALEVQISEMRSWMRAFNKAIESDTVNAAPFAFTLAGPAGVGKSTSLEVLGDYLHKLADVFEYKSVGVVNETDAYDTSLGSENTMVVLDDAGNIRTELAERPVQSFLLRFNSTVRQLLIKADLSEKGMHYANHLFFAVTSNSYHAGTVGCTISPESAARRLGKKIWMDYKPEYKLDDNTLNKEKVRRDFGPLPPGVMPPWATYYEYIIVCDSSGVRKQIVKQFSDGDELLASFRDDYRKHQLDCKTFLDSSTSQKTMSLCEHDLPVNSCSCCRLQPEVLDAVVTSVRAKIDVTRDSFVRLSNDLKISCMRLAFHRVWSSLIGDELVWILDSRLFEFTVRSFLGFFSLYPITYGVSINSLFTIWVFVTLSLLFDQFIRFGREFCSASSAAIAREIIIERARNTACALAKVTTVGYLIIKLPWLYEYVASQLLKMIAEDSRSSGEFVDPLGAPTLDEVKENMKVEPIWQGKIANVKPVGPRGVGATWEQVEPLIMHNVARIKVRYHDGKTSELNCLFLNTATIVLPSHVWFHGNVKSTCLDVNITTMHDKKVYSWQIHASTTYFEEDCAISMMTAIPTMRDITHFLPTSMYPHGSLAKRPVYDGDRWLIQTIRLRRDRVTYSRDNARFSFDGYLYATPERTETGHCGVPIIAYEGGVSIVGFHVCGNGSRWFTQSTGGAYPLTQSTWAAARKYLSKGIYVNPAEVGNIKTDYHSVDLKLTPNIHPKNVINFVDNDLVVLGDVGKVSSPRSNVEVCPLSPFAEKYLGPAPKLGIPDMSSSRSFRPVVYIASSDKSPINHDILQEAVDDYVGDIPTRLSKAYLLKPEIKRDCPYTLDEVMNGIPGHPYLFSLALDKSAGPPFHHATSRLVDLFPDGTRDFKDFNKLEYLGIMSDISRGLSSGTYASAHVKSEPRPINKLDSARAFFAQSKYVYVATVQYFGPPMHVLLALWRDMEHCLGVNPASDDWQHATEHLFAPFDNNNNCFSIDYSKYDMTMQLDLRTAMTKIFIDVARAMGYSEADVRVMEYLSNEWLRPIVSFDGALVQLMNLMISGTYITAIGNSIDNSLLIRYSFFQHVSRSELAESGRTFRDIIKLRILGDDNAGSQFGYFDRWNLDVLKDDLQRIGIGITNGDKTEDVTYIPPSDVEFLKRVTWYNPDLKTRVGCLKPPSILKPLHFFERSRYANEQMSNILMTTVNEAFLYGRVNFCLVASGVRSICEEAELPTEAILGNSYEGRVVDFLQHNAPQAISIRDVCEPPPLFTTNNGHLFMIAESTIAVAGDMNIGTDSTVIAQRNTELQEVTSGELTPISLDYVHTESTDLSHWLYREVLLDTYSFPIAQSGMHSMDPAQVILGKPQMKDKYKYIAKGRWDMKIRMVISASGMHYGTIRIFAIPKPREAEQIRGHTWDIMPPRAQDLLSSQMRHVDMLVGRDSEAILILPFIHENPMVLMAAEQFDDMWQLYVYNVTPIAHCIQTEADPIHIKVYGSIERGNFNGATLLAEANDMGEVEAGATALANTADLLSSALAGVPLLSSAAQAVSTGAKIGAGVARAYGWSRPIDNSSTRGMPSLTGPLCNTNTDIYSRKLAPDVNQGVTVRGSSYGDPYDDSLADENFIGKWNHIDTLTWNSGQAASIKLATYDVTPNGLLPVSFGSAQRRGIPTHGIYGLVHRFWSGSVSYRFTVSAHMSMGGCLAIAYEPNFFLGDNYDPLVQQTAVYSIRDRTQMVTTVHWDNPSVALRTHMDNGLTTVFTNNDPSIKNGEISVFVHTPLVGSQPSAAEFSVGITVEVRAEPNCLWFDYSPGIMADMSLEIADLRPITNKPGEPFPGKILPPNNAEFLDTNLPRPAKAPTDYTSGMDLCCEGGLPPTTSFTPAPTRGFLAPPKDTPQPTPYASGAGSGEASRLPTAVPTPLVSGSGSGEASRLPTAVPTPQVSGSGSGEASKLPTYTPTKVSVPPTKVPTLPPSFNPTRPPTAPPSLRPTPLPTSAAPSTRLPTTAPSIQPTMVDILCLDKVATHEDTRHKMVVRLGLRESNPDARSGHFAYDLDLGVRWRDPLVGNYTAERMTLDIPFYTVAATGTIVFRYNNTNGVTMEMVGGALTTHQTPTDISFTFDVGPTMVVKRGINQWVRFICTWPSGTSFTGANTMYLESYQTMIPNGLKFISYTAEGYGDSTPLPLDTFTSSTGANPPVALVEAIMPVGDIIPGCFAQLDCSLKCFATFVGRGEINTTTGPSSAVSNTGLHMVYGTAMSPEMGTFGFRATAENTSISFINILKEDQSIVPDTNAPTFTPEAHDAAPTDAHFVFNSYSDRNFVGQTNAGEKCYSLRPLLKIYTPSYTVEASVPTRVEKCIYTYDNNDGRLSLYKIMHHSFIGSRGSMNFLFHIGGQGAIVAGRGSEYNDPNREYVTLGGFEMTDTTVNSTLGVTVPYYNPYRYTPNAIKTVTGDWLSDVNSIVTHNVWVIPAKGSGGTWMREFFSVGEDFQLVHWIGFPFLQVD